MKIVNREPSNTLLNTELWTVQSDGIGHPMWVAVTKPVSTKPEKGWHGVLATDGNYGVGTLAQACGMLSMSSDMPAAVAVSIGYPLDHPVSAMVARNTQLTPTPWPEWDAPYGLIAGTGAAAPPSGAADAFVAFLADELMPALESEAGVNPAEWTLAGHSLGGLFTTHALMSRPGRWRRHLAVGSSYWWQKPLMFDRAREFAAQTRALPVSVYVAAGDQETKAGFTQAWHRGMDSDVLKEYLEVMRGVPDIVAETREMADILAGRCGLRVRCDILDQDTHSSAGFAALSRGLRWLHQV